MNLRFFEWLRGHVHFGERYTEIDRYRDFRKTFLDTEHGRRVLHELIELGHVFDETFIPGDPYATHHRDGERSLVLYILSVLNAESAEPLDVQLEEDDTNG